jgi:hypothetical protein
VPVQDSKPERPAAEIGGRYYAIARDADPVMPAPIIEIKN